MCCHSRHNLLAVRPESAGNDRREAQTLDREARRILKILLLCCCCYPRNRCFNL
jgi:hypothetical protein